MLAPEARRYSRTDLLNIASTLESSMKNFFETIAKKFPAKRELLIAFAGEEQEHVNLVSRLLKDVHEEVSEDESARVARVMVIFEQNGVLLALNEGIKKAKDFKTVGEAMIFSAELERTVEIFYCQIASSFDPKDRKVLYDLIVEEHKHRVQVEEMSDLTEAGA
jgi:rubrerythrin